MIRLPKCLIRWVPALLAGFALLFQTGCAVLLIGGGVAAGAGAVAYVRGELKATLDVPMAKAWPAALNAMQKLELAVAEQSKDAVAGRLTARGAGDKAITLKLKETSSSTTEIRIRVGTWGDETYSRRILDAVKAAL